MTFDIRQLDTLEEFDEEAFDAYQDAVLNLFLDSPEAEAHMVAYPDAGFWAAQFMYYGHAYVGSTLSKTTQAVAEEIITDLFPRKITILSSKDADDGIPELIAFWQFLKREYQLRHADAVLRFLRQIEPDFKSIMNDASRFGMAKSFMMMGQGAGFDMTDEKGLDAFMQEYNANIATSPLDALGLPGLLPGLPKATGTNKKTRVKKKKSRNLAKASRKKNRKKRK